ncbi:UNVERIFIED_CONTAM: hypothetical protein Slati_1769700 [Sesamum latifolium]|uniref:Uncharacterized protein n=1 Tax=Sesamum latifolium TaxID=2727402 RepID=A0AAW2WY82_9LAMI
MAIIPERTIKDMTSADLNQQPLYIEYPDLEGRFNQLVKSYPHHQISDHLLIQYFYEGLLGIDRKLIDAVSGGALFNKTQIEARNLILIMASNTQQFGTRYDEPPKRSNEVSMVAFGDQLNKFTSLVEKIAVEKHQHVKACGICTSPEHATNMCPTFQEPPKEHADAIGGFFGQSQRRYDPFSNTYNPGWKDHPNMSYGTQSQNFQRPQYRPPAQPPPSNPKQGTPFEDMMKTFITNAQQIQQNTHQQIQQIQQNTQQQIQQYQQNTQASIQNLESEISQLASFGSRLESQGKMPSQSIINPKQNASAIILRSGKELQDHRDENDTKCGHAHKRKPKK